MGGGNYTHHTVLLAVLDGNITVFMPSIVPDEFSLLYQKLNFVCYYR